MNSAKNPNIKDSEVKKQNQDFPNLSAASEKVHSETSMKKEIKKTSHLNADGKTDNIDIKDNTDKKSEK